MSYHGSRRDPPRAWESDHTEAWRRRSPPRHPPPALHGGPASDPPYASRPPPLPPYREYTSRPPPSAPPRGYRADYAGYGPPHSVPPSPRRAEYAPPPRQGHYEAEKDARYRPHGPRYDVDPREPPAKRFRPSFEPPRVTADTYRPHEDGPLERSSPRMPDRSAAYPPSPYGDSRRVPYPSERYPPPLPVNDRYARPPLMPDYPARPPRAHETPAYANSYYPPAIPDHQRTRTTSDGSTWYAEKQSPRMHSPRMPPGPREHEGPYMRSHPYSSPAVLDARSYESARSYYPRYDQRTPPADRDQYGGTTGGRAYADQVDTWRPDRSTASLPEPIDVDSILTDKEDDDQRPAPLPLRDERSPSEQPIPAPDPVVSRTPTPSEQHEMPMLDEASPPLMEDVYAKEVSPSCTPPTVQRDFGAILRGIAEDPNTQHSLDQLVQLIESKPGATPPREPVRDITNIEWHPGDLHLHAQLRHALEQNFAKASQAQKDHVERLYAEYRKLNDRWRTHCDQLDRIQAEEMAAYTAAQGRADSMPLPTPSLGPLSARSSSRRGTGFFGDAVRSEAEFQELLASLEAEEMTDPKLRATRTAAVVPDLLLPDDPERQIAMLDLDSTLVIDPISYYRVEPDRKTEEWTIEEQSIFCKRFALYPKLFGKIALGLPGRSTADCVAFYYAQKYRINFRSLLDKRRRRQARGLRKGASSLLSNLQSTKGDEGDEEPAEDGAERAPDLDYAATIPLRNRFRSNTVSSVTNDWRSAGQRSMSSKKAARAGVLSTSKTANGDWDADMPRSRIKSAPSAVTNFGSGMDGASEMTEGLLPPLNLASSSSRRGTMTGPTLGYFESGSTGLKQPSPVRRREGMVFSEILNTEDGVDPANGPEGWWWKEDETDPESPDVENSARRTR